MCCCYFCSYLCTLYPTEGVLVYNYYRGARVTFLGLKFEPKLFFWVSQLSNYFFGFMKFWIALITRLFRMTWGTLTKLTTGWIKRVLYVWLEILYYFLDVQGKNNYFFGSIFMLEIIFLGWWFVPQPKHPCPKYKRVENETFFLYKEVSYLRELTVQCLIYEMVHSFWQKVKKLQ